MTTDNFSFYLQNRLIQTSQTGGQRYGDTSPFSTPWFYGLARRRRRRRRRRYNVCHFFVEDAR
jgi:hypothetical protein